LFHLPALLRAICLAWCALILSAVAPGQSGDRSYARKNSFGILTAYSHDSSHIILGVAENRELLDIGLSYSRRLYLNNVVNWQYDGEILPAALNSDPVQVTTTTVTFTNPPNTFTSTLELPTEAACRPLSGSGSAGPNGPTYSFVSTCTRRWVMGEGISPIGLQWNFLPRRKLQPVIEGHLGYMYSTEDIPVNDAGSFNFTFDVGAGFELYRSQGRSFQVEYRYHHISNDETATANPGIDNGVLQVAWVFGR
jgi:hypothetical protein